MTTYIVSAISGLGVVLLSWIVGVEPRIRVQNQKVEDNKELMLSMFKDIKDRLERIERNQNGKH